MTTRYQNLVQHARGSASPSVSAKSVNYRNGQGGDYPIYDGRYNPNRDISTMAPPIQLYNPAFAHFLDNINNADLKVPDRVLIATADLMRKASAVYDNEATRRNSIRPSLKNAISYGITQLVDQTTPDGLVMWTMSDNDGSLNEPVALLIEDSEKRELGQDGCDASIQASFSMLRHWVQSNNDVIRSRCCCPTFLIVFAGPWLAVLGAVLTDKCIVQRLTDLMWIGNSSTLNDAHCYRIARVLYSLTCSLGRLRQYYVTLPSTNPSSSRFFPSPNSFPSSGTIIYFDYIEALERDPACITFLCKTRESSPRLIVVKFAQTYCREAHELLASNGMAPALLYCGSVDHRDGAPSYRPLQMIVMDYIQGKTVAQLKDHDQLPDDFPKQLQDIIEVLHRADYVFGDLRLPNVMILPAERGQGKVQLIDFDWAGKVGEVKYPLNLAAGIDWPTGVVALEAIEKGHDIQMLKGCISSVHQLSEAASAGFSRVYGGR
ncbi:hypothetical protein C8J56DRAFT_975816 [Mycena floridula]|nr:hypothetical protein C8J56DRAFT_599229 [Mycena floridula]KAJ7575277.1 hypothetical protein C8J56DRAFT_975816 [Mycena floridula]